MDISRKFDNDIWIGSESNGFLQKVLFENLPRYCSHCKRQGHLVETCNKLNPPNPNSIPPSPVVLLEEDTSPILKEASLNGLELVVYGTVRPVLPSFEVEGNKKADVCKEIVSVLDTPEKVLVVSSLVGDSSEEVNQRSYDSHVEVFDSDFEQQIMRTYSHMKLRQYPKRRTFGEVASVSKAKKKNSRRKYTKEKDIMSE